MHLPWPLQVAASLETDVVKRQRVRKCVLRIQKSKKGESKMQVFCTSLASNAAKVVIDIAAGGSLFLTV